MASVTYHMNGTLTFKYTADDAGSDYEPFGTFKISVAGETFVIWNFGRDDKSVELGKAVDVPFSRDFSAPGDFGENGKITVDGDLKEADSSSGDDIIAQFHEEIKAEEAMRPGGINPIRHYTGDDGYADLSLELSK